MEEMVLGPFICKKKWAHTPNLQYTQKLIWRVKATAIKPLVRNKGECLCDLGRQRSDRAQKAPIINEKMEKLVFIKIKNRFLKKRKKSKWKGKSQIGRRHSQYICSMSDEGLASRMYKLLQFSKNKTNSSRQKWTEDLNRHFTKDDIYE